MKVTKIIEGQIQSFKEDISRYKNNLQEDFMYAFQWGKADSIYGWMVKVNILKELIVEIENSKSSEEEVLSNFLEKMKKDYLKSSIIPNSTNFSMNNANKIKLESIREIINTLEYIKIS
jgi:hypothetical protein